MRALFSVSFSVLFLGGVLAAQAPSRLYRVPGPVAPGTLLRIEQLDLDMLRCCGAAAGGDLDVVLWSDEEVSRLLAVAPQARFVRRGEPFHQTLLRMQAQWLQQNPQLDLPPDPGYYTVAEVEQEIDALVTAYPAICQKVDLTALPGAARTHNNRSIYALRVSDNVALDEDEPAVVLAAQHHARELNSPHMVIGAMQRVCQAYGTNAALTALVDEKELWFVPMVNPDGVDHVWNVDNFWRKNRRNNGGGRYGVDLNRNYPFMWGQCGASTNTSSQTYRGPSAGSEPETRTLRALAAFVRPELYLDFHSYGQEVLEMYPSCGSAASAVTGMLSHYVDDLRGPMGYGRRLPSASAEAPHDLFADGGAMGFLTEVMTTFQPSFTSTVAEEAQVWPGIERALTTWQPALRGHVTSVFQGQPLEATITYSPGQFGLGEVAKSRARDGRFGLWLPVGSWNVTFSAPGFQPRTVPVTVTALDQGTPLEVELEPNWAAAQVVGQGPGTIGSTYTVTYTSPGDAGDVYFVGWALATTPGLSVGTRVLPLADDFLFEAAIVGNPLMVNNWGVLDAIDRGVCTVSIPNDPLLSGFHVFFAGVTLDPAYSVGVKKFSSAIALTIQ